MTVGGPDASDVEMEEGKCQADTTAASAASGVSPEDLLVATGVFNERYIFVENNVFCNCL